MKRSVAFISFALAATPALIIGTSVPSNASAARPAAVAASSTYDPSPTYGADDYSDGQAYSILPAGENGLVNATQFAQFESGGTRPANSTDQLTKYANLLYAPKNLTDTSLPHYFLRESFGVLPGNITSTETPSTSVPVVIYRDLDDVPHIYGKTMAAAAFGAGYAQAQDRLFFMDVLRHFGEGTLSSFIGPSCSDEESDHNQLLIAPYTTAQAQAQLNRLPQEYGNDGKRTLTFLDNYSKGVNAYIDATQTDPSLLPADYVAAGQLPAQWSPTDSLFVGAVIGGQLGKGGGNEVANAAMLQYLVKKYGSTGGNAAFTNFKEQNDPDAPTTIYKKRFPYEIPHHINPKLTAMPDNAAKPLTGGPTDTTPDCNAVSAPAGLAIKQAALKFPSKLSNALVVGKSHSADHHPIAVFGPQTGYFAPQIWSDEDIHAPGYVAEGASINGTGLVEIGRGPDFAWSATSATTDIVDQRLALICNPNGGKPAAQGAYYLYNGKCRAMKEEDFNENAVTKPGGTGAPVSIDHKIYLTNLGVVQGWTTAKHGQPVAVVNERSTFNHDLDSAVGFLRWANPSETYNAKTWMKGANDIGYTFNWLYVDNRDIAVFTSGADPKRDPHANPNLPTWANGSAPWHGVLSENQHPHQINPKTGLLVSWNNKPARGFSAADNTYSLGPLYRSQELYDALTAQIKAHPAGLTEANVVSAMRVGMSADFDGLKLVPMLTSYFKHKALPATDRKMLNQLKPWAKAGAPRKKAQASGTEYEYHAAVAIMDELEPRIIEAMFNPIFAKGGITSYDGANDAYSVVPMEWVNTPNNDGARLGSAYDDAGWAGHEYNLLKELMGRKVGEPYAPVLLKHVCGKGGTKACASSLTSALTATYQALVTANGGSTKVGSWTADTATVNAGETMPEFDAIGYESIGVVGQPNQDWQNRPTFQQVISFPRHRPRTS